VKHLALILAAASLLLLPCAFQAKASDTDAGAKVSFSAGPKERYEKQVEAKLQKLDHEIADLKARVPSNKQELRREFNRRMTELNEKREAARRELEEFKNSSQQAWRDAKPSLDAAVRNLEKAYKRAASDFK
jgi:predicted RNase H-like nuclease (RuvC/YqgF family)